MANGSRANKTGKNLEIFVKDQLLKRGYISFGFAFCLS